MHHLLSFFLGKMYVTFKTHELMRLFCRIRNIIGVQVVKQSLSNRQHKWTSPCSLVQILGFGGFLHFQHHAQGKEKNRLKSTKVKKLKVTLKSQIKVT